MTSGARSLETERANTTLRQRSRMALNATLLRACGEFRLLEMLQQMFCVIEFDSGVGNAREVGRECRMSARETFHFHLMTRIALRVGKCGQFRAGTAMFRVAHAAIGLLWAIMRKRFVVVRFVGVTGKRVARAAFRIRVRVCKRGPDPDCEIRVVRVVACGATL
jgi:hypothetical protein